MCLNIGTPNNHHFPFGTNKGETVGPVKLSCNSTESYWYQADGGVEVSFLPDGQGTVRGTILYTDGSCYDKF